MFYFAHCINIIFNSLLAQLVKYDVHTTRNIKFIHAIIYHTRRGQSRAWAIWGTGSSNI